MAVARTTRKRIEDSKAKLANGGDAWLTTAGAKGPHLVPLSLAWDAHQEAIIFCTEGKNRTTHNIAEQPSVQIALGSTRDVLMIHGKATVLGNVNELHPTAELFASQVGWDPRGDSDRWVFIHVAPRRMMAWREVNEINGRTIMRHGQWLL